MKKLEVGKNKAGKRYMLAVMESGGFTVWAESINYKLGRMVSTWGYDTPSKMTFAEGQEYAKNGIAKDAAIDLYNRRLAGKAR